jgi:HSP20 family protein
MNVIRWEPFREISGFRRALDRFMDEGSMPAVWQSDELRTLVPPVDIIEQENDVVVKAVVPGVAEDDLNIEVVGDTLTIRGESKETKEDKKENYFYREWRYGTFLRSLTLPAGLKTDKVDAELENGMLTLTIPKAETNKPKAIKVKTKSAAKIAKAKTTKEAVK